MPQMYDLTLYHDSTQLWSFKRWTPDVVCINLGTNDFSTLGYDATLYEKSYLGLVRHVRSCYPQASIVLLSGPMLPAETNAIVKKALDNIKKTLTKKGDKRIYRFDFTPQDGSLGLRSRLPSQQGTAPEDGRGTHEVPEREYLQGLRHKVVFMDNWRF